MNWNYRVFRTDHPDWVWAKDNGVDASKHPRYRYGVHEAYYDEGGVRPHSWTVAPVEVWTEDLDTLRQMLAGALAACDHEVLDDVDDTDPR